MASHVPISFAPQGVAYSHTTREHHFVESTSKTMRAVERVITEIACTEIPVLLNGESGTGKEEVAVRIHRLSRRQTEPFVKIICAALTPDFFESLANRGTNPGDGINGNWSGTVFLDEIEELDPGCQSRLLHLLPEGDAIPPVPALSARIISSTGQDIEEEVQRGHFRKELYYRLKGVCLRLPPLRERRDDIPTLFEHFLEKHSLLLGRPRPTVNSHALRAIQQYNWPGNIRELENVAKKMVALGDAEEAVADLAWKSENGNQREITHETISLKEAARAASRQAERELILQVLTRVRWNRKRAARDLQISYKALLYKLKQIGLDESGPA
ncbi:MAG: sigma 54-interacting transcriptional regulator [Terriglobia bacterium]